MNPYALANHQQNQGYQHLHWTKSLTFFPLTRCKRFKKQIYGFAIEKQFLQLENKHPHQSFPKNSRKKEINDFFSRKESIYILKNSQKDEATKTKKNKRNKKKNLLCFFWRSLLVKLHNPQLHAKKNQRK
jgi:hypothetical protein